MSRPVPVPDATTAFHWEAASQGRLLVQRCSACSTWCYPPEVACTACQSEALVPQDVSGRGHVYSYTVIRRALAPEMADELPYALALVELDEQPGLRMLTNIVGIAPDDVRVDMPVEVAFERHGDVVLPQFRPC